MKNTDLIGKTYRNGDDGLITYTVTAVDSEFPEIVHWKTDAGIKGCSLAVFVRPSIIAQAALDARKAAEK